jgi:hypothetical protein
MSQTMTETIDEALQFALHRRVLLRPESQGRVRVETADGRSVLVPAPVAVALLEFLEPREPREALGAVGKLYSLPPEKASQFARRFQDLGCLTPSSSVERAALQAPEQSLAAHLALVPETRAKLEEHLRKGDVCVIRDAFEPEFAEGVYQALSGFRSWKLYEDHQPHFMFHHHNIYDNAFFPPALERCEALFCSPATRAWMSALSGLDCAGDPRFSASLYLPGDFSLPHDDSREGRQVAYVWHLTKDWHHTWGGEFFWCSPPRWVPPSFNTLILFKVEAGRSLHCVSAVSPFATGRRLTVNGWWTRLEEELSMPPAPGEPAYVSPINQLTKVAPKLGIIEPLPPPG